MLIEARGLIPPMVIVVAGRAKRISAHTAVLSEDTNMVGEGKWIDNSDKGAAPVINTFSIGRYIVAPDAAPTNSIENIGRVIDIVGLSATSTTGTGNEKRI